MKIKQTILALVLTISIGIGIFLIVPTVSADCAGVKTSVINCTKPGGTDVKSTGIWALLMLVINIISAGIGVAAVGGVVYGSVMYSTAGGSPEKVKQARVIIANTVSGLIAYAVLFALLNYLIPGGLFAP
jgi:hypothetical protein